MAIKGDLRDMSLPNLVQMVCLDRREVMLILRHRHEGQGVIYFSGGQITHAELGSMVGEAAVYHLLSWPDGTFEMREHNAVPTKTVTAPWNHILMEGMRLIDEQIVGRALEQIEVKQELTLEEVEQDNDLEQDLILALSRLEQIRARLEEKKTKKQPTLALRLVADIVNEVATFSETLPGEASSPDYLENALDRAGQTFPATRLLHLENTHLSVDIAAQLYGNWSGSPTERKETFIEIGEGMLAILETYYAYFISYFRSSAVAGQWRETCEIFLAELRDDIQKVKF